tara:strand:+ start:345 stop:605 length:261 start_codon:yes stop_codon:yes gene_type:complete
MCILVFSIYMNVKLGMIILSVEDSIEECLDIIDERYRSVSQILEIPIFFDSVEVRKVVGDIEATRTALLVIANSLSELDRDKEEKE